MDSIIPCRDRQSLLFDPGSYDNSIKVCPNFMIDSPSLHSPVSWRRPSAASQSSPRAAAGCPRGAERAGWSDPEVVTY